MRCLQNCVKRRGRKSNDEPQGLKPAFLVVFAARLKPCPYESRKPAEAG